MLSFIHHEVTKSLQLRFSYHKHNLISTLKVEQNCAVCTYRNPHIFKVLFLFQNWQSIERKVGQTEKSARSLGVKLCFLDISFTKGLSDLKM